MEAPTPTRGAPATLQQIPAAALLEAALESEARVATLQEAYEELIQSSMTGVNTTPRSRMSVPPADGSTDGDSVHAGRLRPLPDGRRYLLGTAALVTVALQRRAGRPGG